MLITYEKGGDDYVLSGDERGFTHYILDALHLLALIPQQQFVHDDVLRCATAMVNFSETVNRFLCQKF